MHSIRIHPISTKDTITHTFVTIYESMMIIHQKDIDAKLVCLRGFIVDLIIIPREYRNRLKKDENKEINYLLNLSLTKKGRIKYY